jgi:hypothetical protein
MATEDSTVAEKAETTAHEDLYVGPLDY